MRVDLLAARQKWLDEARSPEERKKREKSGFLAYRDLSGRVADFHALRHTYVSRLVCSGANVKVAQELARHSTPLLTLGRYAHVEILDQTKALDALPDIEQTQPHQEAVKATGTDDASPAAGDPPQARSAFAARRTPGASEPVITCQKEPRGTEKETGAVTLATTPTCGHLSTPDNNWRRGRDSNPGSRCEPTQRFSKPSLSATQPPLRPAVTRILADIPRLSSREPVAENH